MGWEPRHLVETKNIYIILTYIENWSLLTQTLQTPPIPPGAPSSPALPWRLRTKTALACAARFFFRFWSQWYLIMIMWIISGTVGFRRSPVLPFFDNFVSVSSPTRCAPSWFSSSMILKGQINCVTQLMLYIGDKLSSSIFCCLSVSVSGIGNTWPNLHFFQYIQAYKPFADHVPPNTKQYQLILTKYQPVSSYTEPVPSSTTYNSSFDESRTVYLV